MTPTQEIISRLQQYLEDVDTCRFPMNMELEPNEVRIILELLSIYP